MSYKNKFENYGVGLGLRRDLNQEILDDIANKSNNFQWLELVPENFIAIGGKKRFDFERILATKIPLIPHGVNLSIGTAPEKLGRPCFDEYLLKEMEELFQEIKPPWFSDHLSCTRINGFYLQELIPIPYTEEMVTIVADNIKYLEDRFQLSFLFENPSYYTKFAANHLSEIEFINAILEKADCGLLLDVNNIYVNQENHQSYQAKDFIDELDLEKVVQVHIAGHLEDYSSWLNPEKKFILDTHGENIKKEVFDILKYLMSKTSLKAILLERDSNFPDYQELKKELDLLNSMNEVALS
jgi:uncharacterized protein (UPF0276 family)